MTPGQLFGILVARPFPGSVDLRMSSGACCFTVEHVAVGYTHNGWIALGRVIPDEWPIPLDFISDAERVHTEIRRVLAVLAAEPSPTWAEIKADCVGPDLPADDPLYDRTTAAQALAKVTAERDQARQAYLDLSTNNPLRPTVNAIAERLSVCPAEPGPMLAEVDRLKGLADTHAVVSRRLIGSQKEVVEVSAERDESTARADKIDDRLRRDDELREQIAVAVGLDGSASLALILDTVTRERPDDPRGVEELRALVNYHQAPIRFNDRPLTLAERASFVIRRLWQGRTNAANEAASLRRELGDISDALGDLPDTAEREPIGDREEHLGLSTAERIRLSR